MLLGPLQNNLTTTAPRARVFWLEVQAARARVHWLEVELIFAMRPRAASMAPTRLAVNARAARTASSTTGRAARLADTTR